MKYAIFNTQLVEVKNPQISLQDRGVTLGVGLFETIACKNQQIKALNYHWQRLIKSARLLSIPLPFTLNELEQLLINLIKQNKVVNESLAIRLTLTEGCSDRGIVTASPPTPNFFITISKLPNFKTSMSVNIVNITRHENALSSRIKSISYLDNVIAKKEAQNAGFDEAILKNTQGHIAEGAVSNIFIIKNNNTVVTPPIQEGALPGTYREQLLKVLPPYFKITEEIITTDDLKNANEIFLTNALMGVRPVHLIDDIFENKKFLITEKITKIMNRT